MGIFGFHLWQLMGTKFAIGSDGYVYVIQTKSIVEQHRMHYGDVSLIYPFLVTIAFFVKNYILALKIAIALTLLFFSLGIYLLSIKIIGNKIISLFFAFFVALSPSLTFFAYQFPKNFFAITIFMFMVLAVLSKRWIVASILFFAGAISHRTVAVLSIFFVALTFLDVRRLKLLILFLSLAIGFILLLSLFFPGVLNLADLERFNDLLTSTISIFPVKFSKLMGLGFGDFYWNLEMMIFLILPIISILFLFKYRESKGAFFALTIFSLATVFPFYKFDAMSMGYRLWILSFPISVLLSIFVFERVKTKNIRVAMVVILAIISFSSLFNFSFLRFNPPYGFYKNIILKTKMILSQKDVQLVVAHKPIAEMMDFYLSRDVLPWKPEPSYNKKKCWRLVYDVELWEIEDILNIKIEKDQGEPIFMNYSIVREDIWEPFSDVVKAGDNRDLKKRVFSFNNPYKVRPAYLLRLKRK